MSTPNIRNYKDEDFPKLEQLLKDAGIYYEPRDTKEIFKKCIEYDSESIIVAEDNDKLIGTAFVQYDYIFPRVYRLGVHPDYKNREVANKLADEAEKRLKARGIGKNTIYVGKENSEEAEFWKKRGWKVPDRKIIQLDSKYSDFTNGDDRKIFIKRSENEKIESEAKMLKYFSGISSIKIIPLYDFIKDGPFGSELRLTNLPYKDLESLIIPFLGKSFPKYIKEYLKEYVLQIAKIHAYGPLSFLNTNNNLILEEDYYKRLSNLINEEYSASKERFDKILACYKTIANAIGNSKIKTFIKDARLKNALSSIIREDINYNKAHIFLKDKVSLIDFDPEHLRLAPPQHDLSKMLLFSVKDRKKILDTYIETYNSDVKVYNHQHSEYGIKPEIKDKEEFEFVFLNSIVDYAIFCVIEKKYKPSSKFYKSQIKNAVYALDELKNNWQNRYTKQDLEQLGCIKLFLLNTYEEPTLDSTQP